MPSDNRHMLWGFVLVFIGSVMFSAKAVMVKMAYWYDVDPVSLLLLRMMFSLPFYLVILAWLKAKGKFTPMPPKSWLLITGLGVVGYYLASYFDFAGLEHISAGLERLILFMYPTLVLLISALLFKRRVTRIQILAVALTYAGIIYAYMGDITTKVGGNTGLGVFLVFMSALTYACYLIGMGKMLKDISATQFTALAMIISCLFVIAHFAIESHAPILDHQPEVYWLALLMAIFSTVIPSFLLAAGMKHIGSSNASIVASVGPISTIVLAYFFLGEGFSWQQGVAVAMVISGVLLVSRSRTTD